MGCLLEYVPISAAFRCSSRFKMHRNPRQIGLAGIFAPVMVRNTIWRGEYSTASRRLTTCPFRHTVLSTKRRFGSAKIHPAAISIFRRLGKSDRQLAQRREFHHPTRERRPGDLGRDEKRPTTLALGWAVLLLLGQGGPNVEWIIHLCLRNTRREEVHYRSGGPIAAFVPTAVG